MILQIMGIEVYGKKIVSEINFKLKEAELEAKLTDKRYSHDEVFLDLKSVLSDKINNEKV